MRDASVGFQCPECIARGQKSVRTARTVAGGSVPAKVGSVTMGIIVVNVAMFVITSATGGSSSLLFQHGAMLASTVQNNDGELLTGFADGALWRPLTSAFLHSGLLHLAFNMYAIYLFGPMLEQALGIRRFVATYLTTAVAASIFVYALSTPNSLTIGASGAVFGLFAAALLLMVKARQDVRFLLVLLAVNAVISLQGNISWQGHLGGFVTGAVLGLAFAYAPRERRTLIQVLVFVAIWVAVIAAAVLRTAQLS